MKFAVLEQRGRGVEAMCLAPNALGQLLIEQFDGRGEVLTELRHPAQDEVALVQFVD